MRIQPLLCLAFSVVAVRLLYVVILLLFFDLTVAEDYYDDIARNLADGWGYVIAPGETPNLFRYPAYPYFLAMLFRMADEPYALVVATQLLLDLATLALIYVIATDFFGHRTAALAVAVAAIYPFSAVYILRYTTEPLFTFLLAAAMLFLTRGLAGGDRTRFVVAGALLGLAVLCRASLFYFVFLLPLFAIIPYAQGSRSERLRGTLAAMLVAVAVLFPWGMRNLDVTGEFNLLGTAGGYSLWLGNYLPLDGRDRDELPAEQERIFLAEEQRIADDGALFSLEGEQRFVQATLHSWMEQPIASAWLIVRKAGRFWFSIYKPDNRVYTVILIPIQAVLLILAALGLARTIRDRCVPWHLLVLILYLNALHALATATFRYSIPVMPYVTMFAAYGFTIRFRKRTPT